MTAPIMVYLPESWKTRVDTLSLGCRSSHFSVRFTGRAIMAASDSRILTRYFTGADLSHSYPNAEINALLGSAIDCLSRNKLIEAEKILHRVLVLDSDLPDGIHFFGILLAKTGRLPNALTWVERSLALIPTDVMYLNNYGDLLMQSGKPEQAIAALQSAITLGSEQTVTYVSLARAYAATGQVDTALSAYSRAINFAATPDWVPDEAAEYASRSGRHDIALTLLRQRLSRYGAGPQTWLSIGNALRELGDHAGAIDSWKQGLARDPNDSASRQSLFMMYQYLADWESSSRLMQTTFQGIRGSPTIAVNPTMLLPFTDDPELQLVCAKRWTSLYRSDSAVTGIRGQRRQKIRIGYLSNDFRNHATMQLLVGTIELHDRDRFEFLAYSWSPDDSSDLRRRTIAAFDQFTEVGSQNDEAVARQLVSDRIDIAVDLKGYSQGMRPGIFVGRPAPLQISYLGCLGTMGAPWIDYLIADEWVVPSSQTSDLRDLYSEALLRLPYCFQPNDPHRPLPEPAPRSELGLDDSTVLIGVVSQAYKIIPELFIVWMHILQKCPNAVLLLSAHADQTEEALSLHASMQGIGPERLRFVRRVPYIDYLRIWGCCDLILDTFPCNGGTTTSDALWLGTPVLTCVGKSFASRVGASLLAASGRQDLIAHSFEEYETKAVQLICQPGSLSRLRRDIVADRLTNRLFDCDGYVRDLETGFQMAWERHLSGNAPADISVFAAGS